MKKNNKKEINYLQKKYKQKFRGMAKLEKIFNLRTTIFFRRLKNCYGITEPEISSRCLSIDLKNNVNIARIYIHECLHLLYPEWSETRVLREERNIWKKINIKQIFFIYKKIFNRKFKDSFDRLLILLE